MNPFNPVGSLPVVPPSDRGAADQAVQPCLGRDPEVASLVDEDRVDSVAAKGCRIGGVVRVSLDPGAAAHAVSRWNQEQPFVRAADPDSAIVRRDRGYAASRASGVAPESLGLPVEAVETADPRPHPQRTRPILEERKDVAVGYGGRIEGIMPEDDELVSVVTIEAVLGPEPHEPPAILHDRLDRVLREPVRDGQVTKRDPLLLREERGDPEQGDGEQQGGNA
jgi:hypothetical protein